ncbi:MAG: hypothetical protein QF903_14285 [Planctomycetota bacterium]|jgi:Tfp pilus assembly protein PilN|nr:hypothetical protein [Planctomycetota bacterium]MDP6990636.1 hypothetical protein [Planctomycetota bacterium]
MININLLPEEYRSRTRTPLRLMVAVSCVVAVNTTLIAWWGWTRFGVAAEVESERVVLQTELDGLRPQVDYHRSLDTESRLFRSREETLAQITRSRVSWTRKLDEFANVVNRGGGGERHLVWFDDLDVSQGADGRRATAGRVRASGHSGSDQFAQVANFLEDIEDSPFITDFHPPAPPEGSESVKDEELEPSTVWAFPLSLELQDPQERK